jgi:GNAT superfamily N-acetyltransferase
MADVRIRRAGADDAYVVAALHVQFARDLGLPSEQGFLDRFASAWLETRPDHPTWIAESRGQHAGLLSAQRLRPLPFPSRGETSRLDIATLFVGPDHRGRGVGRALVEGLLEWCRVSAVESVRVTADSVSRPFFLQLGFDDPGTVLEYALMESR